MNFRFYVLALLFSLSSVVVISQNTRPNQNSPKDGKIFGKVTEESSSHGIAYASIALHRSNDSSLVDGTITDAKGYFQLENLSFGKYYLLITFIGYEKKIHSGIQINSAQKEVYLGSLSLKASSLTVDEVEVVAEKRNIEYKVDKKVINVSQDIVAAGGTAVNVLENTPSVEVDVDGNLTLRGSGSYTVLIDGKPSVLSGNDALKQISAAAIDKIEIITNPSAKYDPDGIGGIINIVTKKNFNEGFNGIINVGGGMFKNYSVDGTFNYRTGKFNFFSAFDVNRRGAPGTWISEREAYFDTFTLFTDAESVRARINDGYSAKLGLDYEINKVNYISLSSEYSFRNFGFSGNSNYHEYTQPYIYNLNYIVNGNNSFGHYNFNSNLFFQHKFLQKYHEFTLSANYSTFNGMNTENLEQIFTDSDWKPFTISLMERALSDNSGKNIRVKADYTKPFGEFGKLESGFQWRWNSGFSEYKYQTYDTIGLNWIENTERKNDVDYFGSITSGYATYSGKWLGFEYMAGLRSEYYSRQINQNILDTSFLFSKLDFFPSVHVSRQLRKDQQILMSYSRKTERPDEMALDPFPRYMDKNSIRMGNPALKPEYVNSYELSYQIRIKSVFLSAETYYRETKDKMSRVHFLTDSNMMIMRSENIASDYSLGMELMSTFDIKKFIIVNASANLYKYHLESKFNSFDVVKDNFTWNARLSMSTRLPWGTRIQITTSYKAKSITLNGTQKGSVNSSIGMRHDFFNKKLSVALQIRDFLGYSGFGFESEGINYYLKTDFNRAWPIVGGTLTYTFNNYKKRTDRNIEDNNFNQMDMF